MNENVNPGMHPNAEDVIQNVFPESERRIAIYWSREWYITHAGKCEIGQSQYSYFLIKPTHVYEEMFGLTRELIVIFSAYDRFEARTLDAYEAVYKTFSGTRIERICYVLISADEKVESNIQSCLSGQEVQIIIPFTYDCFYLNRADNYFLRNSFKNFLYVRNLFDFSEPLTKDFYFFGRSDLTLKIIDKHNNNQNFGAFGLRKSGKTSIIYDVMRKATINEILCVFIDCEDTSFNMKRWNYALKYVLMEVFRAANLEFIEEDNNFSETDASKALENGFKYVYQSTKKSIILFFDEIENITFSKSAVNHWCSSLDFVYFWQTIRSIYQRNMGIFTFCIFGTNPKCIEMSLILGKDNPIYNIFQPFYIQGFTHTQTREMIRKLGRLMGITFDESIYTKLEEDYGGHPFLMRQVCSHIACTNEDRPLRVDRKIYTECRDKFNQQNGATYFSMLIDVLKQFYPEEYELLQMLATDDETSFNYFVRNDPAMATHLLGYGLLSENQGVYDFKLDAIKTYLKCGKSILLQCKTPHEQWAHICQERNDLETALRKMVKMVLRISLGEEKAFNFVKGKLDNSKLNNRSKTILYDELFDSKKSKIFLRHLAVIINAKWDYFSDYFGDQEIFSLSMKILNKEGRFDAHATIPNDADMKGIDNAVSKIRDGLEKYNQIISSV